MPRISIVTPSFNQGRYLRQTIESVLCQEVDLEYIIVDGCSTDDSLDILKDYEKEAHIIVEPDDGQADAISKGFTVASGEILGWLNSDDMYVHGTLEKVITAFDNGYEFVYGHLFIVDSDDNILRRRIAIPISLYDLYYGGYVIPQETTFFSKRLYLKCGGMDKSYRYAMDYDLWLRMAMIKPPHLINDFLSYFRFHKEQKSRDIKGYLLEQKRAKHKLAEFIPNSIFKCLRSRVDLSVRKFVANAATNGLYVTVSDICKKKLGRLP